MTEERRAWRRVPASYTIPHVADTILRVGGSAGAATGPRGPALSWGTLPRLPTENSEEPTNSSGVMAFTGESRKSRVLRVTMASAAPRALREKGDERVLEIGERQSHRGEDVARVAARDGEARRQIGDERPRFSASPGRSSATSRRTLVSMTILTARASQRSPPRGDRP
jgi:hypothetical protein